MACKVNNNHTKETSDEKGTTHQYRGLPKNESELYTQAYILGLLGPNSDSLDISKSPRRLLIEYINDSKKIRRSMNFASILLVGTSGTGKSSTINHLLNIGGTNHEYAKTNDRRSESKNTSEFIVSSDEAKYEVKDLQLGIVDSPGFNDTEDMMNDILNAISIKKFYKTHPKLSGCKPNLIFIILSCNDVRFVGENSQFSTSLRYITELQLVDHRHPNVVAILTSCFSIPHANIEKYKIKLDDKKKLVQNIIFHTLKVTAPVVFIENKYEGHGLQVVGDFTRLPDGTLQPKNLYTACQEVLSKNNDNLGLVIFNACFVKVKKSDPLHGHKVPAKNTDKTKLSEEELQLFTRIENARKKVPPDPIIDKIQEFIKSEDLKENKKKNMQELGCTLKRTGIEDFSEVSLQAVEYFHSGPISETGTKMLKEKFNIKKDAKVDPGCLIVGQGYNFIKNESLPVQIMNFETHKADLGMVIPTCVKFEKKYEAKSFMCQYEDKKSLVKSVLRNLEISMDDVTCTVPARPGYNKKSDSQNEYSFLFEERLFELEIGDTKQNLEQQKIDFTIDFIREVNELPSKYKTGDDRKKFEKFFNTFGHFMVTSAYGGGSIEIKVPQLYEGKNNSFEEVKMSLTALFNGKKQSANASDLLSQSTKVWQGGNPKLQKRTTIEDEKLMQEWKNSLVKYPRMLSTEMRLEPISTFISLANAEKYQASHDALKDVLGGDVNVNVRKNEKQVEVKDETRKGAIKHPVKKKSCFPSSALVGVRKNGETYFKQMSEISIGDKVIAWDYKRHQAVATEVIMFAHRIENIKKVKYLKIILEEEESITMSGNHLVMIKGRDKATMAKNVHQGDVLSFIDDKGFLVPKKVVAIDEVVESGLFSPITTEGNIIVNNIVASCYCSITDHVFMKGLVQTSAHHVAHLFFLPMRVMYKLKVKWVGKLPENGAIHPYAKWLCKLNLPWTDKELKLNN